MTPVVALPVHAALRRARRTLAGGRSVTPSARSAVPARGAEEGLRMLRVRVAAVPGVVDASFSTGVDEALRRACAALDEQGPPLPGSGGGTRALPGSTQTRRLRRVAADPAPRGLVRLGGLPSGGTPSSGERGPVPARPDLGRAASAGPGGSRAGEPTASGPDAPGPVGLGATGAAPRSRAGGAGAAGTEPSGAGTGAAVRPAVDSGVRPSGDRAAAPTDPRPAAGGEGSAAPAGLPSSPPAGPLAAGVGAPAPRTGTGAGGAAGTGVLEPGGALADLLQRWTSDRPDAPLPHVRPVSDVLGAARRSDGSAAVPPPAATGGLAAAPAPDPAVPQAARAWAGDGPGHLPASSWPGGTPEPDELTRSVEAVLGDVLRREALRHGLQVLP